MKKELIAIGIIAGLVGFIVGYSIGYTQGLNFCIGVGMKFLKTEGIELNINKELLMSLIFQYQSKIGEFVNLNITK